MRDRPAQLVIVSPSSWVDINTKPHSSDDQKTKNSKQTKEDPNGTDLATTPRKAVTNTVTTF